MSNNHFNKTSNRPPSSGIWLGLILLFAGVALLGYKLGLPLPGWLFTWPMILILIGLAIGIKDRFNNPGSWILLLIGFIFLAEKNVVGFKNYQKYIAPIILISIGIIIMLRPKRRKGGFPVQPGGYNRESASAADDASEQARQTEEYLNVHAVFGGTKKIILSKNFKGGSIVTFMGGAEVNLLQADFKEPILLEVNNVFGGTKLAIPSNWEVRNEVTAIFGGVEDKRNFQAISPEPGKTIYIRGTCLFGGLEFSSY